MADSPLDKALKRRDELAKEIAEIDHFVAYYHRFSDPKAERNDTPDESESKPARVAPAHKRKRKKASPAEIARASAESIRAAKRPLSRSELVTALEARGLIMESKDKPRYVGTILWRMNDKFTNLEGHGYWLIGQPYPPASYPSENPGASVGDEPASVKPVATGSIPVDMGLFARQLGVNVKKE